MFATGVMKSIKRGDVEKHWHSPSRVDHLVRVSRGFYVIQRGRGKEEGGRGSGKGSPKTFKGELCQKDSC